MTTMSILQQYRLKYRPHLPPILNHLTDLKPVYEPYSSIAPNTLKPLFPETWGQQAISFAKGDAAPHNPLKVGVVLSGGQAPGGHNVITGLYDALQRLNPNSRLIGFCDGPGGIVQNKAIDITGDLLKGYRNQGGFDIIGSGRTKIETPDQFTAALKAVSERDLDALVIIGGDDSNTNAAFLAEYFKKNRSKTRVIGVPKTIDGDLRNEFIEISFGFDTACKTYSEMIGNIARDALSAKKYYYFIKLMGRSASHIALECALQTHPNMVLIGEEIDQEKKTLQDVTRDIVELIVNRAAKGKNYGVILIPEGIIEFIPEFKQLIAELNVLMSPDQPHQQKIDSMDDAAARAGYIEKLLSKEAVHCFNGLPLEIKSQLLLDRDPHGNVQVSKVESERLFMETVKKELEALAKAGKYKGKFSAQPCFYGYEGRSALPSNFDSNYCYALGHTAALLADAGANGYVCYVRNLSKPVEEWTVGGVPLTGMLYPEERQGKSKPVIKKALVDLTGRPYFQLKAAAPSWADNDDYCYPGPIQFAGPPDLADTSPIILKDLKD